MSKTYQVYTSFLAHYGNTAARLKYEKRLLRASQRARNYVHLREDHYQRAFKNIRSICGRILSARERITYSVPIRWHFRTHSQFPAKRANISSSGARGQELPRMPILFSIQYSRSAAPPVLSGLPVILKCVKRVRGRGLRPI